MPGARKNGEGGLRNQVVQLARHVHGSRIVFFAHHDRHGHAECRERRAQVHVAQQRAAGRITFEIVGEEHGGRPLQHLGMRGAELVGEPARRLELDESLHPFRARGVGTFPEFRRRIRAVPRGRIDQAERRRSRRVQRAERERDASPHGTARNRGLLPPDVIEQFGEVLRKELGGEPARPGGRIVRGRGNRRRGSPPPVCSRSDDAVPHAAIERERMDQDDARGARTRRGVQRVGEDGSVGQGEAAIVAARLPAWA